MIQSVGTAHHPHKASTSKLQSTIVPIAADNSLTNCIKSACWKSCLKNKPERHNSLRHPDLSLIKSTSNRIDSQCSWKLTESSWLFSAFVTWLTSRMSMLKSSFCMFGSSIVRQDWFFSLVAVWKEVAAKIYVEKTWRTFNFTKVAQFC